MAPETVNDDGEANQYPVFIDTSLDTHLATIVSDSDTVSDLKQKIMIEHRQCFPAIGDIEIQCLKVKRRGNFYHLSESMLVKSAFESVKKNLSWFISVDISRVEQNNSTQNMDINEAEDQLALPWVTDCRSIDKQNSPTNQFLVHGSTSRHPHQLVPFFNQNIPNVDQLTSGDSCKDVSKNIMENRSFNDDDLEKQFDSKVQEKQLTVNNEIISKKRTRGMNNENLLENTSGSGPSVMKKRKTQNTEVNLKASERNEVLTYDENSFENRSKTKDLGDDVAVETDAQKNTQVSEIVPEIATVLEKNIEQEMPFEISQKEKEDEIVHKKVIENEIPSSSLRTCDSEDLTKNKAAEMGQLTTTVINNIHEVNDPVDVLKQDVGSNGQESAVDQIDKNKVEGKKKKVKKSTVKKKDKSLVKLADNISSTVSVPIFNEKKIVGDVSSTVDAPVFDEKIMDENKNENLNLFTAEINEVSEKTVTDNVVMEGLETTENMEEKTDNGLKDIVGIRKKKKVGKSAKKDDETVVKTVTNEETVLPQKDDTLMENNAELSKIEENTSVVNAQVINGNEKIKKKKKIKKSAGLDLEPKKLPEENLTVSEVSKVIVEEKNDDFSNKICKMHTDDDPAVTNEETVLPQKDDILMENNVELSKFEENTSAMNAQVINNGNEKIKKKKKTKKSAGLDSEPKNHVPEETLTVSEVSKVIVEEKNDGFSKKISATVTNKENVLPQNDDILMENNAELSKTEENTSVVNAQVINNGNEKIKKKRKIKKSAGLDLEPKNHLAEETLTVSEVSKVIVEEKNDDFSKKIDIPNDKSDDIDFKHYFSPSQQPNKTDSVENRKEAKASVSEKKPKKKTKEPIQSKKSLLKTENKKPSLLSSKSDEVKTSKVTTPRVSDALSSRSESFGRSLQSQKVNKPRSTLGQTQDKTAKRSAPVVKSLLNTAGTIFGDGSDSSSADDNATKDSDSSTKTPIKSSSEEESQSQSPSIDSTRNGFRTVKRKESSVKNSINSQSRMKNVSMADLLRSSSRFKKAKLTASQLEDTESQPVDFVPDSQPIE